MARLTKFDPASLRRYWDGQAQALHDSFYATQNATDRYLQRTYLRILDHFAVDPGGKRVLKLDLWNEATHTTLLRWFTDRGAAVAGVDISGEVVRKARERFEREGISCDFRQGDIRDLPFEAEAFDLVYSIGTIEHVKETARTLDEVYRVLRPGGEHVVGVPNRYNLWGRAQAVWLTQRLALYPFGYARSFSVGGLRRLLREAGFEQVDVTGVILYPWVIRYLDIHPLARRVATLGRLVERLIAGFSRREFGRGALLGEFLVAHCWRPGPGR